MRARNNVSQKRRRQLVLSDFKGADFSSSPYRVDPKRASKMRNMINEYGVNHKRGGWHEARLFERDGKALRINGIFEYHFGEYSCIIVHAGTGMYAVCKRVGDENRIVGVEEFTGGADSVVADLSCVCDLTSGSSLELTDTRSQAFYQKGRLYIIGCGDYLVYGTWDNGVSYKLRRVADCEDTYVPTTTISIDHEGAAEQSQAILEYPNRLTPYRRNQLVGASLVDNVEKYEEKEVTNEDGVTEKVTEKVTETVHVSSRTWKLDGAIDKDTEVTVEIVQLIKAEGSEALTEKTMTLKSGLNKEYPLKLYEETDTEFIAALGGIDLDGKITLNFDTTGLEGDSNITVTFSSTTEGYEDSIKKCQFGVLFGADGMTDRLFLSGNSDFPNADFYSEMHVEGRDELLSYTYFPDNNYNEVGSDASAILGYVRLADSTLVIFKSEYQNEPSIFYRTGSTDVQYDSNGIITGIVGLFPSVAGTLGESLSSRHSLVNFGGDCLMLSQNGVFGVVLGDNARTTERYTRERSRTINERLTSHENLSEAVGVAYKNKYYLCIDGDCFVADGRFTFRSQDTLDGAYNYEWWYWDNIPARVFAVLNNQLYFGTEDGMICRFDDEYTDRTYKLCEAGELSITPGEREVVVNDELIGSFEAGDRITFTTDTYVTFYENVLLERGDDGVATGRLQITEDETITNTDDDGNTVTTTVHGVLDKIYNGIELYGDKLPSGCEVEAGRKYVAVNVDRGSLTFMIALASDAEGADLDNFPEEGCVRVTKGGFNLVKNVKDREMHVEVLTTVETDSTDGSVQEIKRIEVKEYENDSECATFASSEWVDGDSTDSGEALKGTITFRRNVVAEWYTPILDMGTNAESKTLLGITVCTEPETNGRITFGYETRTVTRAVSAKGLNVFSFDDLSFERFSFETGFASSYSVKVNERNFNFIIFRFVSDSDTDCAVNDITLIYKINRKNIGVR